MKKTAFIILVFFLFFFNLNVNAFAADSTYKIGPADVLEISVWKDPDLTRRIIVPPDGIISFPLIGSINVTSLTVENLDKLITGKLSEFVPDATVTVMLVEINSLKAYVIGKVNSPGTFPINLDTNVMQILSMAGGLNPFASKGSINILRSENNKTIKIPFDYGDVEKGKRLEQNIILRSGDVVVVP